MKFFYKKFLFTLFFSLTILEFWAQGKDLPNPPTNLQTATYGSLVIPMDNVNQNNGGIFNLKSYGLVHALLMNDIPVKWVIKSGKVKDAIDFSATAERLYPSFVASSMINFISSAFIIDSAYVNNPAVPSGQTATQVITSFANNVAVFRLTQNVTVDVRYMLNFRPKIAVFNNGGNQAIHVAILNAAGVTNYYVINAGAFPGISQCFTFCSEPHWSGENNPANTAITYIIRDYVQSGGNFLAQCHGIETYENFNYEHTDIGINIINTAIATNLYFNNDMAYMQFHGAMRVNEGGSGKNWTRSAGSSWDPGFYYCVSGNKPDTIVAAAAHLTPPDSAGGNVYYLGGHDYSPFTLLPDINSARLYLNASLVPSGRPVPFTINAGNNNTICLGSSATLGGSPTGPAGVIYLWSPASSLNNSTSANPIATPTITTTYIVNADNGGCTANGTVTVTVILPPAAPTATSNSPVCIGGTLSLSASAAAGATYTWSGPNGFSSSLQNPSIPVVTSANAGTYTVIAAVNGCLSPSTATFVIIGPSPGITTSQTNVSCFGGSNGTASTTATGGVAPYSYLWSNGQTTSSATALIAGTYTVNVTEATGCTNTAIISIAEPTILTSTVSQTNVSCFGGNNGSATVSLSGGTPTYLYLWSNGQTTSSATALIAGNYSVTTTDINGCITTSTFTITEPLTGFNSTVTQTNVSCFGGSDGSASISPSGGTPPYTYLWSNGQTTSSATGLSAGSYTATATDGNGCTVQVISITQPPTPLISIASQTNICSGASNGSTTVSASGGTPAYTYLWNNGQTTVSVTGLPAGNYSVTVTDANGCSTLSTGTVTLFPAISSTASQNNVSCFGGSNGSATVLVTGGTPAFTYLWSNGQTTSSATGLIIGNYSVTVTDANGCVATNSFCITEPTMLTSTSSQTNILCFGGSTGTAAATVAGGTPTYTYLWSNGQTTSSETGLIAGTYSLTITDGNGCTTSAAFTITQPISAIIATFSQNNVSCFGGNDGSAWVSASGGTPPYTYSWSSGETIENISNLIVGNYTVIATDANGCTIGSTITITEPAVLVSTASQTNVCSGSSNGTASVLTSGGTPSYTYLWNNGQTASSAINLSAGNYSVTITDSKGCTTTATVAITLFPAISSTSSQINVSCFGGSNGSSTVFPSGGTPSYTYLWSNGQTTSSSTGLIAGSYTVLVTDTNGCQTNAAVSIGQPTQITGTLSVTNPSCGLSNGSITSMISGGTVPYNYVWASSSVTTANITGIGPGAYSLLVTDSTGCTANFNANLTNIAGPAVSISSFTNVSCSGGNNGTATTNISSGTLPYSISWSPYGGTGLTGTGFITGSYTVNVTDALGCIASATAIITEPSPVGLAVSSLTNVSCNGGANGSAMVSGTGGTPTYTYSWSPVISASPSVTGLVAGTYTATVTDQNSCSTSISINITQPTALAASFGSVINPSCYNSNNGNITVSVAGGTIPYIYSWSDGQMGSTATGLIAGTYSVIVTDTNGCSTTLNIALTQPTQVITTAGLNVTICLGSSGTVTATASGGAGGYYYTWQPGGAINSGTYNITPPSNTTYTVVAYDAGGCAGTPDTVSAIVYNLTAANIDALALSPICPGQGTVVYAVSSGSTGPLTYSWSGGLGTGPGGFLVTPSAPITYVVTVTNSCGVSVMDSVSITFNPPPTILLTSDTNSICAPGLVQFFDNSITGNVTDPITAWLWSFGDGSTSTLQNPSHMYNFPGTYTVILTVTTFGGCTNSNSSSPYIINAHPYPVAAFSLSSNSLDLPYDMLICNNLSVGATTYQWNFGDGGTSTVTNPQYLYTTIGIYPIELISTSAYECSDTAYSSVTTNTDVVIPNVFTPNADGSSGGGYDLSSLTNDVFFPYTSGVTDFKFEIFNRWGELIFVSNDINIGWDGYYKGQLCQQDVYIWKAYIKLNNGKTFNKNGDVTLLR